VVQDPLHACLLHCVHVVLIAIADHALHGLH
jgi:hypothetical protein